MALIKCKNCGKDISSNAEKCVHCGATNEMQESIINGVNGTEKNINFFLRLHLCRHSFTRGLNSSSVKVKHDHSTISSQK